MSSPDRVKLLGAEIDRLTMAATLARCEEIIAAGAPEQHVVVNASKLGLMRRDPRLREIVRGCALVNADGQSVVWASRLLGDPLPERVAGIDLMLRLIGLAEERGYRVFVLGAREHVLREALARLQERHPRLQVAGVRNGYFAPAETTEVCTEIRESKADILFVAMTSPGKEYWLAEHRHELGVPLSMGVGGAIDVVAGYTARAPFWAQKAGLEWLFRLLQEPRRLLRRYAVTNTEFVALVAVELVRRRILRRPGG
jgi:N-acetylglucosaminyldiphosphoundecaprenol N-acetyl-beta-D-mannosaminyltransferase